MNLGRVRGTEAEKMSRNPSCFMARIFTNRMDPVCPYRKGLGAEIRLEIGEGQLCSADVG